MATGVVYLLKVIDIHIDNDRRRFNALQVLLILGAVQQHGQSVQTGKPSAPVIIQQRISYCDAQIVHPQIGKYHLDINTHRKEQHNRQQCGFRPHLVFHLVHHHTYKAVQDRNNKYRHMHPVQPASVVNIHFINIEDPSVLVAHDHEQCIHYNGSNSGRRLSHLAVCVRCHHTHHRRHAEFHRFSEPVRPDQCKLCTVRLYPDPFSHLGQSYDHTYRYEPYGRCFIRQPVGIYIHYVHHQQRHCDHYDRSIQIHTCSTSCSFFEKSTMFKFHLFTTKARLSSILCSIHFVVFAQTLIYIYILVNQ